MRYNRQAPLHLTAPVQSQFWFSKHPVQPSVQPTDRVSYFNIRAATSKDLMDLAEILADSFHSREGMGGLVYPLLRLGIYEDLRSRLNSGSSRYVCLVALAIASKRPGVGDRLVGTVEISVRSRLPFAIGNCFEYAYLSNLAVDRNCRRQGAAKKLLLNCERIARSWGFEALYLHVLENNRSARRLYFKLGYRLHKVDGGLTCLLLGKPRRLLLVKNLSNSATTDET